MVDAESLIDHEGRGNRVDGKKLEIRSVSLPHAAIIGNIENPSLLCPPCILGRWSVAHPAESKSNYADVTQKSDSFLFGTPLTKHNQELHEIIIDGTASRLDNEDILVTNAVANLHIGLLVGEL